MHAITILCVTRATPEVRPLLTQLVEAAETLGAKSLLVGDSREAAERLKMDMYIQGGGYLETILEKALMMAHSEYILRIDDDERISAPMLTWLREHKYRNADHWKFPRAHLFIDDQTVLVNPPLWPDHQTRLSVRAKAGGRNSVHAGSPFGGGTLAPVLIEHHKFLVKSYNERMGIAKSYDKYRPGYGTGPGLLPLNLPEDAFSLEQRKLVSLSSCHQRAIEESLP